MSSLTSILAVTDFSDGAWRAACRAARLAGDHGAQLALLHVVSSPDLETLRDLRSPADAEIALVADARRQLAEVAELLKARTGIVATSCLVKGPVIDEIAAAGEAVDATCDVLVDTASLLAPGG